MGKFAEDEIYSVDRIEGKYAVLVGGDGESADAEFELFGGREPESGEVYIFDGEKFTFSEEITESRRRKNARRTRALFD